MGEETNGIRMLPVRELYPHPENPRRDVGDVTELAESMRKNGVMQNLTVMPRLQDSTHKGRQEGYTVLIGHRRLAAAKKAGIKELPCKIVMMGHSAQIKLMLEENMQRSDLTFYEQARSFQMLLDLGETEETISKSTGFSRTTVRHRLQIAKLDPEIVKSREGFQLSIKDYIALEKLPDIEARNRALQQAETSNELQYNIDSELRELQRKERYSQIKKVAEAEGKNLKVREEKHIGRYAYESGYKMIGRYGLEGDDDDEEMDIPANATEIIYGQQYGTAYVIAKVPGDTKDKKKDERKERQTEQDRRRKDIRGILKAMAADRRALIMGIVGGKYENPRDMDKLTAQIWQGMNLVGAILGEYIYLEYINGRKSIYEMSDEEKVSARKTLKEMPMWEQMLMAFDAEISRNLRANTPCMDYQGHYRKEGAIPVRLINKILREWGYTDSPEQEAVLDGTSALYE